MANTQAALDAVHRGGLDDTLIARVRDVCRPVTPDERAWEARVQRDIAAAGRAKADLDAMWTHMTFAQWAERKARGTRPSTR